MQRTIVLLLIVLLCTFSQAQENKPVIKAAVAEGFADGLHAKYLRFIADKLSVKLSLSTMPFARRIQEIRNGNLDIIVGLQKTEDREDEFIYIEPYYESLSYRFFSLNHNKNKINKFEDLYEKLIGVNKHSRYFPRFDKDNNLQKIDVVSLRQNIKLLLKGRIDLLIHYQESAIPTIESLGATQKIAMTNYQPSISNKHYIAISHKSFLVEHKDQLQEIIKQAIKNKELLAIRLKHYAEKH